MKKYFLIFIVFVAVPLKSLCMPIDNLKVEGRYYLKGFLTDTKVEVVSLDKRRNRVEIFNPNSGKTYWVSPKDLINTTDSLLRDKDRIENIKQIYDIVKEELSVSSYKLPTGPSSFSGAPAYKGFRICLHNLSKKVVNIETYFHYLFVGGFSRDAKREHHKLTRTQRYAIDPGSVLNLRFEKESSVSIDLAWKRSDMNNFVYTSAKGLEAGDSYECDTIESWNSLGIVAGVPNSQEGTDYWANAWECEYNQLLCGNLKGQLK